MYPGILQSEVIEWSLVQEMSQVQPTIVLSQNPDEEDIITGCRKKERAAQKKLYEKYYGKMMGITRRYIKNSEDALEVVNTGFLRLFNNIDTFKGYGSFAGWISKIMINAALDFLRSNKIYSDTVKMAENFESKYDLPIEAGKYEDIDIDRLYQMIMKLPPMTRTVFNLFAIDGFSHSEISSQLKISTGTSKWHVCEARQRLKDMLLSEDIS